MVYVYIQSNELDSHSEQAVVTDPKTENEGTWLLVAARTERV